MALFTDKKQLLLENGHTEEFRKEIISRIKEPGESAVGCRT
jgi:hypothetical protein